MPPTFARRGLLLFRAEVVPATMGWRMLGPYHLPRHRLAPTSREVRYIPVAIFQLNEEALIGEAVAYCTLGDGCLRNDIDSGHRPMFNQEVGESLFTRLRHHAN